MRGSSSACAEFITTSAQAAPLSPTTRVYWLSPSKGAIRLIPTLSSTCAQDTLPSDRLVVRAGTVCFDGRLFTLTFGGLFRFFGTDGRFEQRIVYAKVGSRPPVLGLLSGIAWIAIKGQQDNHLGGRKLELLAMTAPLRIDCGAISRLGGYLVGRYTRHPVRLASMWIDPPWPHGGSRWGSGHTALEVWANLDGATRNGSREQWAMVDLDQKIIPRDRSGTPVTALSLLRTISVAEAERGFDVLSQWHQRFLRQRPKQRHPQRRLLQASQQADEEPHARNRHRRSRRKSRRFRQPLDHRYRPSILSIPVEAIAMNLPMSVVIDFSDAGDGTPRDARSGRALGCDAVFDRYTGKQNATDIHPAEYTGALKQSRLVHKSTSAAIARAAWSVLWQDPSATALGPRDGLSYDYLYRDLHQHQASVFLAPTGQSIEIEASGDSGGDGGGDGVARERLMKVSVLLTSRASRFWAARVLLPKYCWYFRALTIIELDEGPDGTPRELGQPASTVAANLPGNRTAIRLELFDKFLTPSYAQTLGPFLKQSDFEARFYGSHRLSSGGPEVRGVAPQ